MRYSPALAALIGVPVLITVTACGPGARTEPLRGTVVEEEYEPPQYSKRKQNVTERRCTYNYTKKRNVCMDVKTGKTKTVSVLTKGECYELDIRVKNTGRVVETCDKAAYEALRPGDFYDSSKYSEVTR
jgi:hypothetical protein